MSTALAQEAVRGKTFNILMVSRNTQIFTIAGAIFLLFLGALVVLLFQQQRLSRELAQISENRQGATSVSPVSPASPPQTGPIYGDIGFQGEVNADQSFVFKDWNGGDEIKAVEVFASAGPTGGTSIFKIASDTTPLPKPYPLGTIPNGFQLVSGESFSRLEPGKYRVEITAVQQTLEVIDFHYLHF